MSESHPLVRSYDEREVALILKRAVEMQEGHGEGPHRLTLADVQQIAREVGIDPGDVARAAATLERHALVRSGGVLGAPTSLHTSTVLDRELTDAELGELLDQLRGALGLQGKTSRGLDTVEWSGKDSVGGYSLSVSRRAGKTRLHLGTQRSDQAAVVVALTGMAGMFGLGAAATAIDPATAAGFWAIVAGTGVATAGTARFIWQRIARRWEARLRDLATQLRSAVPAATTTALPADATPSAAPLANPTAAATLPRQ